MPVEHIGEFGSAGVSREWISAQAELAIKHISCQEVLEDYEDR